MTVANREGTRICRVDELPSGEGKAFDLDGRSIAVFRKDDELFAYRNICPHMYAQISFGRVSGTMLPSEPGEYRYGFDSEVVRCPWHNWEFNLRTGHSMFTGDRRRLTPVAIWVEDGWAYVQSRGHKGSAE